ncbi:hypothetical protein GCM10017653_37390 [Ancylobacter defluvii]|uniref:Uncharacterized protein n=1 Tax=Ancylobacter defluvii TaxID=1282440 RepID=A0A9W6K1B1_9HYPH|nr:hypothetical protein GCM10017653_37390 [Ancylobacter defluvii]
MALRLSRRDDVEFESYRVLSGEVPIGIISRHTEGPQVFWTWVIGHVHVSGDGFGPPQGGADTREQAQAAFATRWRLWLAKAGLVEVEPVVNPDGS